MEIPVGISNRHIHLTKESVDILFGEGYNLKKKKSLTQPGQFACEEVLTIKTAKSSIDKVRVIGPVREYNQIEISKTDAYILGINPPIRTSGDIKDSEVVTLIGPCGQIVSGGCIIANRHVHISPKKAEELNLKNGDIRSVKINTVKGGILDSVYIKIQNDAYFELHLDTDDANAHLLKQNDQCDLLL